MDTIKDYNYYLSKEKPINGIWLDDLWKSIAGIYRISKKEVPAINVFTNTHKTIIIRRNHERYEVIIRLGSEKHTVFLGKTTNDIDIFRPGNWMAHVITWHLSLANKQREKYFSPIDDSLWFPPLKTQEVA